MRAEIHSPAPTEGTHVAMVLPCRNEALNLPGLIAGLLAEGATVIVVDNDSSDDTAKVAERAGAIVVSEPEHGYGAACLRGLTAALATDATHIGFMDADGSDPPSELPRLMLHLQREQAELVLGVRRRGTPGYARMTSSQRFGNWFAPMLMRHFFRANYTDMPSFKVAKRSVYDRIKLRDRDYGFTIEFLIAAHDQGIRAVEVPIAYQARQAGVSKVSGSIKASVIAGIRILSKVGRHALRAKQQKEGHS
jgi:glycosyltransferase involved in cell wall biosynthesis